jgi:predicted MPP superfamily phosphohydrolase
MDRINTRNTHKNDHPLCRKWGYQMHFCILWFSFVLWTRKSACKHKSWISWGFFNEKKSFNYTWTPTLLEVTISDIHYDLSFTIRVTAWHRHISNFRQFFNSSDIIFYCEFNWYRQTLLLVYQTHTCMFLVVSLKSSLRKFYDCHHDLVGRLRNICVRNDNGYVCWS